MLVELDRKKMAEIARRNDIARKLGLGVTITNGAAKLPDIEGLLRNVRSYNNFTEKNDPYEAHDMGFFEWRGERVIWKIDYYNETLTCFEDPISDTCKRIITVMIAKEY
jgi:hypothetical protein